MKIAKNIDNEIRELLQLDRAAGFRMLFDVYYTPLCRCQHRLHFLGDKESILLTIHP